MKLVLIPAGTFLMGSPAMEKGREKNEGPQRQVTISKFLYVGIYEVTQSQWRAVMGTEPWSGNKYAQSGANNAASYISWNDASKFCELLSKKTGKKVSLPTEAQWEYTCRAGSKTAYCFGDDASKLGDYAWYRGNTWDKDEKYAHPVGQKKPNDWGLYDMHGNVFEWCEDWYETGKSRVLRGGCWGFNPGLCRSALRNRNSPDFRSYSFGFRVALDLP